MIPRKPHLVGLQVLSYILSSYFLVPLMGSFFHHYHDGKLADMNEKKKRFGVRGSVEGGGSILKIER